MIQSIFYRPASIVLVLATLGGSLIGGCAEGGGGVDVPNSILPKIEGMVSGDSGCLAGRAKILLRPADWNAARNTARSDWNTTTDPAGHFSLATLDTGKWILEVRDTLGVCASMGDIASNEARPNAKDIVVAMRLQRSVELSGRIVSASLDTSSADPVRWKIVVPGIDRTSTPDSLGNWILKDMPSGSLVPTAVAFARPTILPHPLASVSILPGQAKALPPVVVGATDSQQRRVASGTVTTEIGNLASGASIALRVPGGASSVRSGQADDSGRFALVLPDSGDWLLEAITATEVFLDTLHAADLLPASIQTTLARYVRIRLQTKPVARAAIDDWEPRNDAVPSYVKHGIFSSDQIWLGYSDGRLYVTATTGQSPSPPWMRLDSAADGHGGVAHSAPAQTITAIAPTLTNDEYTAYVGFAGDAQSHNFWKVSHSRGGLIWTDLSSILPVGDIQNIAISRWSGIVYVLAGGTLWYSIDDGATFSTRNPGNDPYQPPVDTLASTLSAFAPDSQHDKLVAGTIDGQLWTGSPITPPNTPTWTKISAGAGNPMPAKIVTSVAIDERDTSGNTIYASFGGRPDKAMWVTRDGGRNWLPLQGSGLGTGLEVSSVSVSPAPGATTLYCNTDAGAFRSDDGGATWSNRPRKTTLSHP